MENPLKSWKAIFLLSIVVPVSLLTTFKLTGIFKEPMPLETAQLEPINWTFQRPYPEKDIDIYYRLNATYIDSKISCAITLEIWEFDHTPMTVVPPGDFVRFGLFVDALTNDSSHVQRVEIMFRNDTQPSYTWILQTSLELTNLTLTYFRERYGINEFDKTHLILVGNNNPNKIWFKATGEWLLNDASPYAENHTLEVIFEVTYYNGSVYEKLVQPFYLTVLKSE